MRFGGAEPGTLTVDAVINSAGLGAQQVARSTEGYSPARVPRLVLAKGNYFGFNGKPVFTRLIYPAPVEGGLGTHVTLDLAGRMRFGPDVEWIDEETYTVDPKRSESFYASVRTYWPALPDNSLVPDYCGIRPKLTGKGEAAADFLIDGPAASRPAAARAPVRDRVARPHLGAVDRRGGGRADSIRSEISLPEYRRSPRTAPALAGAAAACGGRQPGRKSRCASRAAPGVRPRPGRAPWRRASRSAPP